jgi:hypothetical protein
MQAFQQLAKLFAVQCAACGHHTDEARGAGFGCGLECRLDPNDGRLRVCRAQGVDGSGSGGVAGHHQSLDGMLCNQVVGNGMRALQHVGIVTLAIGRMAVVGHIHKALPRHFCLQRAQHTQAAHTAVKDTNGLRAGGGRVQVL